MEMFESADDGQVDVARACERIRAPGLPLADVHDERGTNVALLDDAARAELAAAAEA